MGLFNSNDKKSSTFIRKYIKKNFDKNKPPIIFEVGRSATQMHPDWKISAIRKDSEPIDKNKMEKYVMIYITKPTEDGEGTEEMKWKRITENEIFEFDVS